MNPGPVTRAIRGGLTRRRVQTIVIGLVLLISTAASVLALGLLVDSNAPFDHAFAAQRGAHVTAIIDTSRASRAQLAATRRLPGVIAASGPFPEATVTGQVSFPGSPGRLDLPPVTLAGRSSPGGPVDDVTLDSGRWVQRPGEIVVSRDMPGPSLQLGQKITVTGVPGRPRLTVVGIAKSITDSADGWVEPAEMTALRTPATPPVAAMLYRFRSAGAAADIRADVAAVSAALPDGALTASQSYLAVKLQANGGIGPIVPFLVAFGVIGLVMSVLIVANVISGAVVAGYRRIGILKSIGFTPGQVVAAYVAQVTVSAVVGCLLGVVLGNALSIPLLGQTGRVYGVGALAVPAWVDLVVPAVMLALVGVAALLPAWRAGRLSAVQAIATGRAPRQQRGYAAHRLLGRLRLPRPATIGLAAPFARPARTAVTLAAIVFGATAVTFAVGLSASLQQVADGLSHARTEQVQVDLSASFAHIAKRGTGAPAPQGSAARQQRLVEAVLRAQPGTLRYVAEAEPLVSVSGLAHQVPVHAFRGDAGWTGYGMISGHWYHGKGQADVNTYFLTVTGRTIGDTVTITFGGKQIGVRIVGEVFAPQNNGPVMITGWTTLASADPGLTPQWYDVGLRPGTSPQAYVNAVSGALGPTFNVGASGNQRIFPTLIGLVGTLTLLLAMVAGLGVLNTVVLQTRERVHDLGVFKAIGMTPRQTVAMVMCWVAGIGLIAGVIAIPVGIALHSYILPVMANAAGTRLPPGYLNVYRPGELIALALAGLVIAVLGALLPAGWAARTWTASALHAE